MNRPAIEWLRMIADDELRENAISQCISPYALCNSLRAVLAYHITHWYQTPQGYDYWANIFGSDIVLKSELKPENDIYDLSQMD